MSNKRKKPVKPQAVATSSKAMSLPVPTAMTGGFLIVTLLCIWALFPMGEQAAPPTSGFEVINTYPHDPKAFCQGLIYVDDQMYESTGLYGQSSLRKVDLQTGTVQKKIMLGTKDFGEGLTMWDGQLFQLSWENQIGFVYDKETFQLQKRFRYRGEGWGITHDGKRLIVSDGTNVLRFYDPKTFRLIGQMPVMDRKYPVKNLNELEFVEGEIYANVWTTNRIARISPTSGEVLGWIDLTGLLPKEDQTNKDQILNGIAYDATNKRLFVTGKLWPKLFEIKVVSK